MRKRVGIAGSFSAWCELSSAPLPLLLSVVLVTFAPSLAWGDVAESSPTTLVRPIRVAERHLFLFLGIRGRINDLQGVAVARLKEDDDPGTDADDPVVTVYGVNSGAGDLLYTRSLSSVAAFGKAEDHRAGLLRAHGIAADPNGHVFVADTGNGRVVHLLNKGGRMQFLGSLGEGRLAAPFGVGVDGRGRLYVTDPSENRLHITDYEGHPFAPPLEIPSPTGIAVSDTAETWSYLKEDAVYLVCGDSTEIRKLGGHGRMLARAKSHDIPGHLSARFAYLALDYYGNVYATDPASHAVHKFDPNLRYLTTFGSPGSGEAEFLDPRGIAIHRRFGQVFILEKHGGQYYWIGADLRSLEAEFDQTLSAVVISFFPTERSLVNIGVYKGGKVVRPIASGWTVDPGPVRILWDLKDTSGQKSGPGSYSITLRIEPTYSSYTYFNKKFERMVAIP